MVYQYDKPNDESIIRFIILLKAKKQQHPIHSIFDMLNKIFGIIRQMQQ